MSEADDAVLHLAATVEEPRLEVEADEPSISVPEDVAPKAPRGRSRSVRKPRPVKGADDKPPTRGTSTTRPPRTPPKPKIGPRVADAHAMLGGALSVLSLTGRVGPGVGAFGQVLVDDAKDFGEAWEAYCKSNPRVAEALERLLAASDLGLLITLYARAAMQAKQASMLQGNPDMAAMFAQMTGQQGAA